jgi:hypothetical protein
MHVWLLQVVKEPLFLCDVDRKLSTGQYAAPGEFANDIRHHFFNVKLYNPDGDPFRKIGIKVWC